MATTRTDIHDIVESGAACEVLAVPPDRQLPDGHAHPSVGFKELTQTYTELARRALDLARLSAVHTWRQARYGTARGYSRAMHDAHTLAARSRQRARDLQRDYPLQVLAGVAGLAFLAGIAGRIWRSRAL